MMIYFVIVNYYASDLIKNLLISIELAQDSQECKILVVNNSPDAPLDNLLAEYPQIIVINAEKNLGFGGGCNLGIDYVYKRDRQALIWLINPDTTIDKEAILYITQCFQQVPSLAILGTRIRDTNGEIWFSKGRFNPWIGSLKSLDQQPENEEIKIINCRWVSGCSLILNLARFDHCPRFDDRYFLYYEDADLCERYYQQGYPIGVTQKVLVTHEVSAITGKNQLAKFTYATYSKLWFLKQHGTILALWLNLGYMLGLVIWLLPRDREVALGRWNGLKNFIAKLREY